MRMIRFPDIGQFRNVVQSLRLRAQFAGKAEDGSPVYDESRKAQPVTFSGTIKLDGTNAAICFDGENTWFQSRERILTLESDNYGFCQRFQQDEAVTSLISSVTAAVEFSKGEALCIFGEWIGKGIAKGMAVCQIEREFIVFGVAVCSAFEAENADDSTSLKWIDLGMLDQVIKGSGFDTVLSCPQYSLVLDPENAEAAWHNAELVTNSVVSECPFGKLRGKVGAGEGIVWFGTDDTGKTFLFKTKGQKQSVVSSPKELPNFESQGAINTFVNDVLTEARLNQGIERVFTANDIVPSIEKTGSFLQWISRDIKKEEGFSLEALAALGITKKKAMGPVNRAARDWFMDYLKLLSL
jgi:hypothetical protein